MKGDISPWVLITIIIVFIALGITLVALYQARLQEGVDEAITETDIPVAGDDELSTCTDSDGGRNYFTEGSVTTYTETYDDECDSGQATEHLCLTVMDEVDTVTYVCPNGCDGNACSDTPHVLDECEDSDGGKNYFAQGTVTLGPEIYQDECKPIGDQSVLVKEYFCEKEEDNPVEVKYTIYQCPILCEGGACLEG